MAVGTGVFDWQHGALTATLHLGAWVPNQKLYLLWADDNGSANADQIGNEEGAYTIDNFQVMPPANLRVTRRSSTTLEVAWPYPSDGYQLQATASLAGMWEPVVGQDGPGGGWHRVVVSIGSDSMFYQLVK